MQFISILDSIILEGKDDSFATIIYPDINALWIETLPKESKEKVLKRLKKTADPTSPKIYIEFINRKIFKRNSIKVQL